MRKTVVLCLLVAVSLSCAIPIVPSSTCRVFAGVKPLRPLLVFDEPECQPGAGATSVALQKFATFLEQSGYTKGLDLHLIAPCLTDYISDGCAVMADAVCRHIDSSSSPSVDIVACGTSGLLARLAIETGLLPCSSVRNLIMVSSPNRGTFVADVLKSIIEIVKHESLLEKETRSGRLSPFGTGSDGPAAPDNRVTANIDALMPGLTPWADETTYVAQRVRTTYEPLYAHYVQERHFALPYIPVQSPKETFAGWVYRTLPRLWQQGIECANQPPDAYGSGTTEDHGLTVAYYEILSMEIARNQYSMRLASGGSLLESLLIEPYVPVDWRDGLAYYGAKVLGHYAKKALVSVKAGAQQVLVDWAINRTSFVKNPESPLLKGLIKDDIIVNLGSSASQRFVSIPANAHLTSLNASSVSLSSVRTTRYVSIAAQVANPWVLVWPQIGPNDLLLEVDSAIAPAGPKDLVAVFKGLLSPSRQNILSDKKAQSYILGILRDSMGGAGGNAKRISSGEPQEVAVSSWEPAYLGLDWGAGMPTGSVSFSLPPPPEGFQYQVWSEADGSEPLGAALCPRGGSHSYVPPDGGKVLGLRLVPLPGPSPMMGTVKSSYSANVSVKAVASLGATVTQPSLSIQPPDQANPEYRPPSQGSVPAVDGPLAEHEGAYPLVRVINRSKRTTHKEPKDGCHCFWTIDFGDGVAQRIDGNATLRLLHEYRSPGTYTVRAQSFDSGTGVLYEEVQSITVVDSDHKMQSISFRSAAPPEVDLRLSGPIMWVTGKPAVYEINLDVRPPPDAEVLSEKLDPAPRFAVLWERSGDFTVSCAATVKLRYTLESAVIVVENTYVYEMPVAVLTTGAIH